MKNIIKHFALLLCVSVFICCQKQEPQVSAGRIDTYKNFPSHYIEPRTVRVWLPENYDTLTRYDVLYMHDGQMLFDSAVAWNKQEWGVDEAMDSLMSSGLIRPTIVVAIDNTSHRIGEYCPDDIARYLPHGHSIYMGIKPRGNNYLNFIVEELKPFVDATYSTNPGREHTWIMGSSCGGLISSYALCKYPHIFAGAACLSTHSTLAYPFPDKADTAVVRAYREYLKDNLPQPESGAQRTVLYMDCGDQTLDANYAASQEAINEMLRSSGWDSEHYVYRFFPGAAHTENDWRARLDIPLLFLLGTEHNAPSGA